MITTHIIVAGAARAAQWYTTVLGAEERSRITLPNGRTTNPIAKDASEGGIDPWLRTLSFWNGDEPLAADIRERAKGWRWSANRLKNYGECCYKFFGHYLPSLEEQAEPEA